MSHIDRFLEIDLRAHQSAFLWGAPTAAAMRNTAFQAPSPCFREGGLEFKIQNSFGIRDVYRGRNGKAHSA